MFVRPILEYACVAWSLYHQCNAAINVMPHPTQYGDGGDAVGIGPSRKSNSPPWGRLTKSQAHLLIYENERIWHGEQMAQWSNSPTLGQSFKFKSPPKAPHVPYRGWGLTLIGA